MAETIFELTAECGIYVTARFVLKFQYVSSFLCLSAQCQLMTSLHLMLCACIDVVSVKH